MAVMAASGSPLYLQGRVAVDAVVAHQGGEVPVPGDQEPLRVDEDDVVLEGRQQGVHHVNVRLQRALERGNEGIRRGTRG